MKFHVVVVHFTEPWHLVWDIYSMCAIQMKNHEFKFIVYHRGGEDYEWKGHIPQYVQIIPMENVGRESYAVHYHICKHYDNLPDRMIFTPANWRTRAYYVSMVLRNLEVPDFLPTPMDVPWSSEQYFQLDKWHGLSDVNRDQVSKQEFTVSSIRPFGKWYEARIPVPYKDRVVLNGVLSIPKEKITQYPVSRYQEWLAELQNSGVNPEIGHYWERAWYSLFS